MKNRKKTAFTIAELMIVIGIIGVLVVATMTVIKPVNNTTKYLYMNAYNTLSKAYYNSIIAGYNPFIGSVPVGDVQPNVYIYSTSRDTGAMILCRGLTSFINTTTNQKNGTKDYSSSCSETKITSNLANSFTDANVQFTATNGMRYFISNRVGGTTDLRFYIVYVDVNGANLPNSILPQGEGKNRLLPDIFPFALLSSGLICPLGPAEYDPEILTARYAYFSAGDVNSEPLYSKVPLTYYQAKGAAWGTYTRNKDETEEYDIAEPFTMNDVIRSKLSNDSLIVKDFPDLSTLDPVGVDASHLCSDTDIESCFIFLEDYNKY